MSLPRVTVSIWCGWQSAGCSCCYICHKCSDSKQAMCFFFCPVMKRHCEMKMPETKECTCEMSITESQLRGRAEVRSLKPSNVEMIPFWSIRRIMVPSTKKTVPYLSTVMPEVDEKEETNASQTVCFCRRLRIKMNALAFEAHHRQQGISLPALYFGRTKKGDQSQLKACTALCWVQL